MITKKALTKNKEKDEESWRERKMKKNCGLSLFVHLWTSLEISNLENSLEEC